MSDLCPYIGVTGFSSRAEIERALDAFRHVGPVEAGSLRIANAVNEAPSAARLLMCGVLVKDTFGPSHRYPGRYPAAETIADIFSDDPRALNLLHFCSSSTPDTATLMRLHDLGGPRCHGFQFNGAWPFRGDLMRLRQWAADDGRPVPRVVLQVRPGRSHIDPWGHPSASHYGGLVTDLLFDASGGRGQVINVLRAGIEIERAMAHWSAVRPLPPYDWAPIRFVVAGGLCAETMGSIRCLLGEYPELSLDMEGRLRTPDDKMDLDRLACAIVAAKEIVS